MTKRMIKFPSIEQFRNVVHNVTSRAHYAGKDELGNVIYDTSKPLPTLAFQGTVKLHGTNAGIACDAEGTVWCQSRENIITPMSDNAGFAMYVEANKVFYRELLNQAMLAYSLHNDEALLIFGEWCGGNIQKKVAITQFPKMFVIFGMARVDAEGQKEWFLPDEIRIVCERTHDQLGVWLDSVHHIYEFPTWEVEIDFARPHDIQNHLVDLTIAVEQECPVGKQLGATIEKGPMIGEGIVWKCVTSGYEDSGNWFKVKGELHQQASKVKTLNPVDVERIDAIHNLAVQVTPEWRLEQMFQQTFDTLNGGQPDIKRMGDYIKAVMADVMKEELDTVAASGFTTKEVTGSISKIARDYLLKQLEF
jgi:RNA ligase